MSKSKEKAIKYAYPSRFGSHSSMVVEDCGANHVVCEDEHGKYLTERHRIDSGLTDPNRCNQSRLGKLFQGKKEKDK